MDHGSRGKDLQQQQQQQLLLLSRAGRGATITIWATPIELNLDAKFRSYIFDCSKFEFSLIDNLTLYRLK